MIFGYHHYRVFQVSSGMRKIQIMYTNKPAPYTRENRIQRILTRSGSIPRCSPIPPHTPAIHLSRVERYRFPPVDAPPGPGVGISDILSTLFTEYHVPYISCV